MAVGGLIGFRTLLYKEVLRFWKVSSRPWPRRC
jgi:ABC-2 type transport system permease protein